VGRRRKAVPQGSMPLKLLQPAVEQVGEPAPTFARPRILKDAAGKEFVAKADEWVHSEGSSCNQVSNEILSAELAYAIGVPVPPYEVLTWEGVECFGSEVIPSTYKRVLPNLLAQVANLNDLYTIMVFDVWILNVDRHPGNFLVSSTARGPLLWAIDHGHAPEHPGYGAGSFEEYCDHGATSTLNLWPQWMRDLLTSREDLVRAVGKVQNLPDEHIGGIVRETAYLRWSDTRRSEIVEFLTYRKGQLRSLVNRGREFVPAIREQAL
jgi:hypothetical protein